ncbi:DNA/RNA non-specific endonuclease [Jiella sonneratiae]|uniref:DNA/RNA non-specific endonuclease n=1 Tax=Jiella sonneratiae TaxID=2816856 RepID=A0ABS3J1B9_9HYPH|nr:DNA/RNA non-specific endonuclease [Jiella sonneratiae]MBO0903467.1 DNA/RNA non-specific endonuclease [Jiella sonneratiae]
MANREFLDADAIDRAKRAAERWKQRTEERERRKRALERGAIIEADKQERVIKRVNRLDEWAATAKKTDDGETISARESFSARAWRPEDIGRAAEERILETKDLLSIEFFELGLVAADCVGRITTGGQPNGTGFLVAPGLVMTNHHVLASPQEASASRFQLYYEPNEVGVPRPVETFLFRPQDFFLTDTRLDFTLVAIEKTSQSGTTLDTAMLLPLIGDEGKARVGEALNIVQHPAGRPKEVVIRNNRLLDLPEGDGLDIFFHYESDTEQGSSGSPVFNDQWEVVALHHSSVPKTDANGELVDAGGVVLRQGDSPDRIVWVANEGIRVSRLVNFIRDVPLDPAMDAVRDEALATWALQGRPEAAKKRAEKAMSDPTPITDVPGETQPDDRPGETPQAGGSGDRATDDGPSRGRHDGGPEGGISGGGALSAGSVSRDKPVVGPRATCGGDALPVAATESGRPDPSDPDYKNRVGYDPVFLGEAVPLPTLRDASHGPLAATASGPELKYHHYSVMMNERRRLAYVSAVNIDGAAPFQQSREGSDRWYLDPRLAAALQADGSYYRDNPLDRGHLVRRADAAWGHSTEEAERANDDTFHFTNCSPQHEIFNQSRLASRKGLMLWGNLENAVARLAGQSQRRLSVMNGPVFTEHDRPYRHDFFVPAAFWKLVIFPESETKVSALAFRLSQADQIAGLAREAALDQGLVEFRPQQIAIAELEAITGLDFGTLRQRDAFAAAAGSPAGASAESVRERVGSRVVTNEADIVFASARGGRGAASQHEGAVRGAGGGTGNGIPAAAAAAEGERISYEQLKAMMLDPKVPDETIARYLTGVPKRSGAFSPEVRPDPAMVRMEGTARLEVESALGWGNALSRWRRNRAYELRRIFDRHSPVLVEEGDSWFQFPFLIKDVIDHLGEEYLIWSLSAAGDTAENMVRTEPEYMAGLEAVREHGVRAFLFSAAGNDVIGEDLTGKPVLGSLLKHFEPGKSASWHIDETALRRVLETLERSYETVVDTIHARRGFERLPILVHGYDYAIAGGFSGDVRDPSWAAQDEWLGGPMRQKGIVDPQMQRAIVRLLIDRLYDMLNGLAARKTDVHVVDVRGTLELGEWADEIHGTDGGFGQVAEKFRAVLRRVI